MLVVLRKRGDGAAAVSLMMIVRNTMTINDGDILFGVAV